LNCSAAGLEDSGLQEAVADLLKVLRQYGAAIGRLESAICIDVLGELRTAVSTLPSEWEERLDSYQHGRPPGRPFSDPAAVQGLDHRERLTVLARGVLPPDHPLFALPQFGLTLGEQQYTEYAVFEARWARNDASLLALQRGSSGPFR
jgi:hypothetical protein